jgi:hypothetical protein
LKTCVRHHINTAQLRYFFTANAKRSLTAYFGLWETNMRATLKIIGLTLLTGLAALSFMSFMAYVGPGGGGALDTRAKTAVLCEDANNDPLRPKLAGCIPTSDLNPGEGEM